MPKIINFFKFCEQLEKPKNKFLKPKNELFAMAGSDDVSQGLLNRSVINQKESASSWDAGSYSDGDNNTGNVLRRTKPNIPLQQSPPEFSEDLGTDPGMYIHGGERPPKIGIKFEQSEDPGIYSFFGLEGKSAEALYNWSKAVGIPNPVKPSELHSTCVFSPVSFSGYIPYYKAFSVDPNSYSLSILGDALVLKFTNKIGESQWEKAKKLGAHFTFSSYTPHITLSYEPGIFNYLDFDDELPKFTITFEREFVKTLDKEDIDYKFSSFIDKAKDTVKRWVDKGDVRKSMTHLARLVVKKKDNKNLHPGKIKVYRGENEDSISHTEAGTSWTKSKEIAKRYAGKEGKIVTRMIAPSTPALDINKILPRKNEKRKDQEVFVTHMESSKIAEQMHISPSLLEIVTKKMDEDKKKGEKIIINPELNQPNTGPSGSGNNAPEASGQSNVNGERAQS
jgi:hypothetical protein